MLCRIVSFLKLAGILSLLLMEAASGYPSWSILSVLFWHCVESCCKGAIACLVEVLSLNDMDVLFSQGSSTCCCSATCWGFVCLGEVLSPCPDCTPPCSILCYFGFAASLLRLPSGSFLGSCGICFHSVFLFIVAMDPDNLGEALSPYAWATCCALCHCSASLFLVENFRMEFVLVAI